MAESPRSHIAYDRRDGRAYLTIDRPAKRNALTFDMLDEIVRRIETAEAHAVVAPARAVAHHAVGEGAEERGDPAVASRRRRGARELDQTPELLRGQPAKERAALLLQGGHAFLENAVTTADVQRVARRYLATRRTVVVQPPQ